MAVRFAHAKRDLLFKLLIIYLKKLLSSDWLKKLCSSHECKLSFNLINVIIGFNQ